jgi:hypothetical protein
MIVAILLTENFTEALEIEGKLAQGRDGRGELSAMQLERHYPTIAA